MKECNDGQIESMDRVLVWKPQDYDEFVDFVFTRSVL